MQTNSQDSKWKKVGQVIRWIGKKFKRISTNQALCYEMDLTGNEKVLF